MGLRPVPMTKLGFLGLRSDEARVLTVLHDLHVAQVEPLSPGTLAELTPERSSETFRRVGDETLRFRALLSALPPVPTGELHRIDSLDALFAAAASVTIDTEVADLVREDDRIQTEEKATRDTIDLLAKIGFYTDRLELLRSKNVLSFVGEGDAESLAKFRAALPASADVRFLGASGGESPQFLLVARATEADAVSSTGQSTGVKLTAVPALTGTVVATRADLEARTASLDARRQEIRAQLEAIARTWYPTIAAVAEALEIENRKAEVLTKLGASRETFALEAWVPKREVPRLESVVKEATGDRVYFYAIATTEEPPTIMSNPAGVRRFEFFVRFYSLPQASEWDPTLVFSIVFPIFFGFMLADWGYGLVILLIAIWMIRGFPGARRLPKSGRNFVKMIMGPKGMQQLAYALLPGCAIAIGLGLYTDAFFGYGLFHRFFGYRPGFEPLGSVSHLLLFAGYVGLGMVVLGFVFGALKEYFHHHRRGVVAKVGGILFAFGIAFTGLALLHHALNFSTNPIVGLWVGLVAAGFAMMLFAEGVMQAALGLLEVVSHILSFTRLVGILLASVVLALVINTIATLAFHKVVAVAPFGGPIFGILVAAVVVVGGQSFNVILGVFEPGIQGARLIFVEYFSKFYSGNGRPFRPFGGARRHTIPSVNHDGKLEPIVQAPES
jgi:V/A-type H+-transporting ATPase subunit I